MIYLKTETNNLNIRSIITYFEMKDEALSGKNTSNIYWNNTILDIYWIKPYKNRIIVSVFILLVYKYILHCLKIHVIIRKGIRIGQ